MLNETQATIPLEKIYSVKHEPKHLAEITGHEDAIARLQAMIETKKIGHVLITGPDGCGKLTMAKCFARDLFGDEYGSSVSVVHASNTLTAEERKQAQSESRVSATRIGSMAGQTLIFPKFLQARVKPVVELKAMNELGFKILVVTDFDQLRQDQQGFRRLMELYGANCRFILLTTQVSSVIDPILSRCQIFLLGPVTKAKFYKELTRIGNVEGFKVTYTFINSLYYVTKGNIGRALNLIQVFGLREKKLNEDNLFEILTDLESTAIQKFLETCLNANFLQAKELYFQIARKQGLALPTFLDALREEAFRSPLPQPVKAAIIDTIADVDARSVVSAAEEPHVVDLALRLGSIVRD
jgi:replication factor C small subunit